MSSVIVTLLLVLFLRSFLSVSSQTDDQMTGLQPEPKCEVEESRICDQRVDCSDFSDERGCPCPDDMLECDCDYGPCEINQTCFRSQQQCDGVKDCGDGSDEVGCPCTDDSFKCDCYETADCLLNRSCVPQNFLCDGTYDCSDWSDEKGCTCPNNTFQCDCFQDGCAMSQICLAQSYLCDGWNDCGDWSDEKGCTCPNGTFKCDCYQTGCLSILGCVPQYLLCDGNNDCNDWSDEKECTCPNGTLACDCYETDCLGARRCLEKMWFCDGLNDCGDWSDERNCNCSDTRFQCNDDDCIDRSKVNDGKTDCVSEDDEFICDKSLSHIQCDCIRDNDLCTSASRCIPNSWIGDSISDCANSNDEPCNASKVLCNERWVVINNCSTNEGKNILLKHSRDNVTRCHMENVPFTRTQNFVTNWICITSHRGTCVDAYQCESGEFISNEYYCDTVRHCNDGSDEDEKQFGFRCSGKSRKKHCVLPQKNVYDSVAQCADSSDLCFVNGEFRCFSCLDRRLIVSADQVCDGLIDCYDMSDECLCANQTVCDAVLGEETSRCPHNQIHSHNGTDCVDMDKYLCNSSIKHGNRSSEIFCHQDWGSIEVVPCEIMDHEFSEFSHLIPKKLVIARRCDGRPECGDMNDECECEPRPSFCDTPCTNMALLNNLGDLICDGFFHDRLKLFAPCKQVEETNCPMRFDCKSKDMISIDKRSLCDGIFDCDDHSDENNTDCLNKRFYCKKGKAFSIDKAFLCDGIEDCDNGDDEDRLLCGEKRFYCESGEPISVDKKLLENGIKDCFDGSDECLSLFSDRYEMIANLLLRALFWIMGIVALGGNLMTNLYTLKDLAFSKYESNVKHANDIYILNLTTSDFLMGIYLIAMVGQGVRYSGNYCFVDKEWRSSFLCSGFGTLALISSETSAFILAAMTTFRLITVYKPFISSFIKIKWIVISVCSCWILSTLIAMLPWIPFDLGYFLSDFWFPNMFLKTDTVSKLDMFILANRVSDDNSDSMSLSKVKEIISEEFKHNPIKGEFGYYGETSVCMPRIYASSNEAAWHYSTFLITLNFVLFVYMVVAYVLVYKKANGMKKSRSTKKDPNKGMQKRISRLLLTDFCCWIPVCMMGYLSVAGVALPPNAYIVSAGFLLPINSAMNPILYSKLIGQHISRGRKWIMLPIRWCSAHKKKKSNDRAEQLRTVGIIN